MNIKTSLLVLVVTASITNLSPSQTNQMFSDRPLNPEATQRIIDKEKPKDTTKTPTSPDVIEHGGSDLKGGRRFHRKRIFFGTLKSGEPHYATIYEHSLNPQFNNIKLVIRKKASFFSHLLSWLPFSSVNAQDYFETIGIFGDKTAQQQLKTSISAHGGLWCPNQENPEKSFFIGGTRETCMCDMFKEFEQQTHAATETKGFKK